MLAHALHDVAALLILPGAFIAFLVIKKLAAMLRDVLARDKPR